MAGRKKRQDPSQGRLPPQNLDAEQAVLGSILLGGDAILKVVEIVDETSFYDPAHRKIFSAMMEMLDRNEPIDLLTVTERLAKKDVLDEVGGPSYLAGLMNSVPNSANIRRHARIVREKAIQRGIIEAATSILEESYQDASDVDTLLDDAEKRIFEIAEKRMSPSFVDLGNVLSRSFDHIEQLYNNKERVTGIPTGFTDFDVMTSGFQPSELIIVAGRPSMGKTAFCLNIAQYAAVEKKRKVAIFSLEMSKEQLALRLLCAQARVNGSNLRTGYLAKTDWPKLTTAAGILAEAPIFVDDTPNLSALEIKAKARRLQRERGLDLIIIDYLQLMRSRTDMDNRQQEIAEITRSLKSLAKELNLPVVALSQLSRRVEDRSDRRPQLSDLRESGAIEQDADLVAFIYRGSVYKSKAEPGEDYAEIIIGKQRNGPIGTVKLTFLKEYTRFENYSDREVQFIADG